MTYIDKSDIEQMRAQKPAPSRVVLHASVDPDVYALLKQAASAHGHTLSGYVRLLLTREVSPDPKPAA